MANSSSGTSEERNHHDTSSGNSTTPAESSGLRHDAGISMNWTGEELAILDYCLARFSSGSSVSNVSRYAQIASWLENKTVRDVAMRCRWIYVKEKNKKEEEDDDGFEKDKFNNKEIIDMVMGSNLTEKDVVTIELLDSNAKLLNQISANLTSLNVIDNYTLLVRSRDNMKKILNNLYENMPERMKLMPPLPEKLSDELADSILPPSSPPNLP